MHAGFATTGPTPHQRTPIRCPGLKTKVSNWFHDAYGFIKDNKADPKQIYPWTLFGARTESYVIRGYFKSFSSTRKITLKNALD